MSYGVHRGGWSTEGCQLVAGNHSESECECDHLTNFAILMSPVRAVSDLFARFSYLIIICISHTDIDNCYHYTHII